METEHISCQLQWSTCIGFKNIMATTSIYMWRAIVFGLMSMQSSLQFPCHIHQLLKFIHLMKLMLNIWLNLSKTKGSSLVEGGSRDIV